MTEVLSTRALNRSILARQFLIDRSTLSIPDVLDRIGGIQAQYAPSMYIGLWSRVEGFERRHLDDALVGRAVVQGTLQRATIHLVSPGDYWPYAMAIRERRRQWWLKVQNVGATYDAMEEAAALALDALAGGPLDHADLEPIVGKGRMVGLHQFADLVRVPPSGTWAKRRANRYGRALDWVGPEPDLTVEDAIAHAVRRYLTAFGPARPKDTAAWAGVKVSDVRAALTTVDVEHLQTADGEALVDLPGSPRPHPDTPVPVRFLPTWDAVLLAHARLGGFVRDEDRPRVFNPKNLQSVPSLLVDGEVVGTWQHDGRAIVIDYFRPLPAHHQADVDAEAGRLLTLFE